MAHGAGGVGEPKVQDPGCLKTEPCSALPFPLRPGPGVWNCWDLQPCSYAELVSALPPSMPGGRDRAAEGVRNHQSSQLLWNLQDEASGERFL